MANDNNTQSTQQSSTRSGGGGGTPAATTGSNPPETNRDSLADESAPPPYNAPYQRVALVPEQSPGYDSRFFTGPGSEDLNRRSFVGTGTGTSTAPIRGLGAGTSAGSSSTAGASSTTAGQSEDYSTYGDRERMNSDNVRSSRSSGVVRRAPASKSGSTPSKNKTFDN